MKFFSQLKEALLEKVAGDPLNLSEARFWYNTLTQKQQYRDSSTVRAILAEDTNQFISNKTMTTGNKIQNPDQIQAHKDDTAGLEAVRAIGGFEEGDFVYDTDLKKYFGIEGTGASQSLKSLGGGGSDVTGTYAAPSLISAAVGVAISDTPNEFIFIKGNGGAIDITAIPQIPAATTEGSMLTIMGTSATDTVRFDTGDGLSINGPYILGLNESITLIFVGGLWQDIATNF